MQFNSLDIGLQLGPNVGFIANIAELSKHAKTASIGSSMFFQVK
jgi:hypothetical protein